MNWEAVSAIGEIVSATAVVLSLIYVAVQVRQNTKVSKASTVQQWAAVSAIEKQSVFDSADLARLIVAGSDDRSSLGPEDRLRYDNYMMQVLNTFEFLFLQHLYGTIDSTYFESKVSSYMQILKFQGVKKFWESSLNSYDPRFKEFVNNIRKEACLT